MQPRRIHSVLRFTWRGIAAHVTVTQNYRIEGWTQLEIVAAGAGGPPLPIALDGRRVHGLEQAQLDAAGGLVPYLTAWADREATNPAYAAAVARWKEGDLFNGR